MKKKGIVVSINLDSGNCADKHIYAYELELMVCLGSRDLKTNFKSGPIPYLSFVMRPMIIANSFLWKFAEMRIF